MALDLDEIGPFEEAPRFVIVTASGGQTVLGFLGLCQGPATEADRRP